MGNYARGSYPVPAGTLEDRLGAHADTKQDQSERNAPNGYAGLAVTGKVAAAQLGTGTADATTYLRGDGSYADPLATLGPQVAVDVVGPIGNLGTTRSETVTEGQVRYLTGVVLNANHTLTVTLARGARVLVIGKQDATGARTFTVSDGSSSTAISSSDSFPTTANASFVVELIDDGTDVLARVFREG